MFPTRAACLRLDTLESRVTPATNFVASGAAAGGLPLAQLARPDGTVLAQFQAFESSFRGGVRAAAGELDGDPGTVEVAAAAGPGGAPRVRVVSVDTDTGAVSDLADFFAYESTFRNGVRVAIGDVGNPGGLSDRQNLIVGAEQGGGPRVRVLRLDDAGAAAPIPGPLGDFFAFEPSFRGGVRVAAGELDGNLNDGDELIIGAGPRGAPRVQVLRGDGAVLADYFAFRQDFRGGVNVGVDGTGGATGTPRIDALADDFSQRLASLNAAAAAGTNTRVTGVGTAPNVAGVDADTVLRLANAGIISPSDFNALVASNRSLFANSGLTGTALDANTVRLLANAGAISNTNLNAIVAANPGLFTTGGFNTAGGAGVGTGSTGLGTTGVGLGNTGFGTGGFGTTGAGLGTTGVGLGTTGFGTSGFGTGITGAGLGTTGVGLGNTGFGTGGFGTTGAGGTGLTGTGFSNLGFGTGGVGANLAGLGLGGTGFNSGLLFGSNGLATTFPFNGSSVFAANPGALTTFPTLASPAFASGFFGSAGSAITSIGSPVTVA